MEGAMVSLDNHSPRRSAAERSVRKKIPALSSDSRKSLGRLVRTVQCDAETRHGYVCSQCGVDHSNVPARTGQAAPAPILNSLPRSRPAPARDRKAHTQRIARHHQRPLWPPWRLGLTMSTSGAQDCPCSQGLRVPRRKAPLLSPPSCRRDELAAAAGLYGQVRGSPVVIGSEAIVNKHDLRTCQLLYHPPRDEDLFRC